MFKLRISIAVLCVLSFLTCLLLAKPKQKDPAHLECDKAYWACIDFCEKNIPGSVLCRENCAGAYYKCELKPAISAPPSANLPPLVPTTSPTPTPKRVVPQGTLTQASPTATPKRLTRQPQGTLTQASPSPSPNTIFHATKKEKKK